MKTSEIRQLVQEFAGAFWLRLSNLHKLPVRLPALNGFLAGLAWLSWGLVIVVVLLDLLVGRYRSVGPLVLAVACGVSGVLLGRWIVQSNYGLGKDAVKAGNKAAESDEGNNWVPAVVAIVFLVFAISALAGPMKLDVPENATLAWTFPPGQEPRESPYIYYVRIRQQQCEAAPCLLFFCGLGFAVSWYASRRMPQHPAGGDRLPAPAATAIATPHPGLVASVLFVLFLVVAFRISLSE